MAFKIVIGLCYFSPLPWTQLKWVSSPEAENKSVKNQNKIVLSC